MTELIRIPDIGNGEGEVIELLVKAGDRIEVEQSLLTLESDKASMEIPAPQAGVITRLLVKLGDRLKSGDELLELETSESAIETVPVVDAEQAPATVATSAEQPVEAIASKPRLQDVRVPDIGTSGKAKIIELLVKVGDRIEAGQSLLVLESDKASMEIPASVAGIVTALSVKLGDQIGTGDPILQLQSSEPAPVAELAAATAAPANASPVPLAAAAKTRIVAPVGAPSREGSKVHAGPAVRQLARQFGIDLTAVTATGPHQRILKEDIQLFVKQQLRKAGETAESDATSGAGIPPIPSVDFSKFGKIEEVPLTRLMHVGASNLHRSWLNVPHVTQFDHADISELEAFRNAQKAVAEQAGVKLTVLPFLLKTCARLLQELPDFNSSLAPSGKALIRKKYIHIGFAVDTPEGLLVPVIRNVEQKSLLQLATEAAELADKARSKKLAPDAMQGACFTISSLGHIGGTGFTPIVNAPEVAILGVSKASMQPVWDGQAFVPRLLLPLSLSYDHRVINGAAAARFTKRLGELLGDIRTLLL